MIHCNYCKAKFQSLIDSYNHICLAKKVNWNSCKRMSKESRFLLSSIKIPATIKNSKPKDLNTRYY